MGRPRTPSNVLQLKGAFAKNPNRGRERENELPVQGTVGEPRESMLDDERACWEEMKGLLPEGVLGKSDRVTLELASMLLAAVRRVGIEKTNPAMLARLGVFLGSMGMTPADRSKVKLVPPAPRNEFEGL